MRISRVGSRSSYGHELSVFTILMEGKAPDTPGFLPWIEVDNAEDLNQAFPKLPKSVVAAPELVLIRMNRAAVKPAVENGTIVALP